MSGTEQQYKDQIKELVEVEKHLRKRKYSAQREELAPNIPHSKILHTMDESEQICEKCGSPNPVFRIPAGTGQKISGIIFDMMVTSTRMLIPDTTGSQE